MINPELARPLRTMNNQPSIKPQETGGISKFPTGSVSVDGKEYTAAKDSLKWIHRESSTEQATPNPVPQTEESLKEGERNYKTFCAVCHGSNGLGKSPMNKKGMTAPSLVAKTPQLTDGYIMHQAKYGSGRIMPSLGYATTDRELWEIVHYIRTLEK